MRDIKKAAMKAAEDILGPKAAGEAWRVLIAKHCGGAEPKSEAGFAGITPARLEGYGITPAIAQAWGPIFGPGTTSLKEDDRASLPTPVLLSEYVKGAPPGWIVDELLERSRGREVLFVEPKTGKVFEAESAQWIDWRKAGVPLGDGEDVQGKWMVPVRIGTEKPAQKHLRDPFGTGQAPLTMPGLLSVCGARFEDIPEGSREEVVMFLRLAFVAESLSPREQRDAVAQARKGIDALREAYPLAKKRWDGGERPSAYIEADSRPSLASADDSARDAGVTSGSEAPSNGEILSAITACGMTRDVLLSGIRADVVAGLRTSSRPDGQHLLDLSALREMGKLTDGSVPLRTYLVNALTLAGGRVQEGVFSRALRFVPLSEAAAAPVIPLVYIVGAEWAGGTLASLKAYLKLFEKRGSLRVVADTDVPTGRDWRRFRAERQSEAALIVMLMTSAFIASDDFDTFENVIRKVPVLVESTSWKATYLRGLVSLPRSGKPLSQFEDKSLAFQEISEEIAGAMPTNGRKA